VGKLSFFLYFILFSFPAFAQQVRVDGYFTQDSARLGERVGFVLKVQYPESSQVIFPDSLYNFAPLVLLEKKTFISNTSNGITLDSTIYFVSNFSLDPSVYLSLPVYELVRYDSVTYFSPEAELKLKFMLDSIPEQPIFQENNIYQPIPRTFNWLLVGLIAAGILVLLSGLYWIFSKQIAALFKSNREKLRWAQFERKWKKLSALLSQNPALELADEVVGLWKGYLESITDQPFQEWTSSEITEVLGDKEVFKALREIDMIIYAGKDAKSAGATDYLLQVAKSKYQEKLNKIRNDRTT
jgi:hypothetical protein